MQAQAFVCTLTDAGGGGGECFCLLSLRFKPVSMKVDYAVTRVLVTTWHADSDLPTGILSNT